MLSSFFATAVSLFICAQRLVLFLLLFLARLFQLMKEKEGGKEEWKEQCGDQSENSALGVDVKRAVKIQSVKIRRKYTHSRLLIMKSNL